jgi:hypothetical protein
VKRSGVLEPSSTLSAAAIFASRRFGRHSTTTQRCHVYSNHPQARLSVYRSRRTHLSGAGAIGTNLRKEEILDEGCRGIVRSRSSCNRVKIRPCLRPGEHLAPALVLKISDKWVDMFLSRTNHTCAKAEVRTARSCIVPPISGAGLSYTGDCRGGFGV